MTAPITPDEVALYLLSSFESLTRNGGVNHDALTIIRRNREAGQQEFRDGIEKLQKECNQFKSWYADANQQRNEAQSLLSEAVELLRDAGSTSVRTEYTQEWYDRRRELLAKVEQCA